MKTKMFKIAAIVLFLAGSFYSCTKRKNRVAFGKNKRVIITFIMLVATISAGNAQFFVEGNVGVHYSVSNTNTDIATANVELSKSSINFSPQAGYWLNDNIAVGTRVTFSQDNSKNTTGSIVSEDKRSNWRISAFSRYKLWGTEKICLLLDGSIYYEKNSHSTSRFSSSGSQIGILVFPAVSYNLNEKFSIITGCNFLSMELYSVNGKSDNTDGSNSKTKIHLFDFGANSTLFSLTNIKLGFIYNF